MGRLLGLSKKLFTAKPGLEIKELSFHGDTILQRPLHRQERIDVRRAFFPPKEAKKHNNRSKN
jgi:hypothetical protein